jgi:alkylation response protein AidB-like acyl-CoA dehydrogenase
VARTSRRTPASFHDVFAPGGGEPQDHDAGPRLIDAARRVAEEVLAPTAEATDQADIVPVARLRALADEGLFGLFAPPHPVTAAVGRAVFEALAGACGVTFFVWVQHHAPVRLLAASANVELRERWLPRLAAGDVLGGVAFAHLRRPGRPAVAAEPVAGGGYRLIGEAPWVTSWALAGVYAVAALTPDQRVVFAAVTPDQSGLTPSGRLRLAAMNASSTVRLTFDGVRVDAADVIVELPLALWREQDRAATAQPNPAAFGVTATCMHRLAEIDSGTAATLGVEWQDCRRRSYTPTDDLDALVALRAWSLELAVRSAYALVVATGGRSMERSHPAQRLLREAAFYAIQAQTPPLRAATLGRVTPGRPHTVGAQ